MNIYSKQVNSIHVNHMDITSVLGFFGQIKSVLLSYTALITAMGNVWTAFLNKLAAYDDAYAQTRKWLQTDELKELDEIRDKAVRGFMNTMKAMLSSPNAQKAAAAKRVQFVRDKYNLDASDEYMKETTALTQMIQDMEANCQADLALTGLDEWFTDMKTKNEAFLAKMNERTEEQAGMQKGIVRETRLQVEEAYRDIVKLLNAMAICEFPAGLDFNAPIDRLNAEIEHYRQILARKGISTGTASPNNNNGGGASPDPSQGGGTGGGDNTGTGDNNQGGGTGTIDVTGGGGDNTGGGASPSPSDGGGNDGNGGTASPDPSQGGGNDENDGGD